MFALKGYLRFVDDKPRFAANERKTACVCMWQGGIAAPAMGHCLGDGESRRSSRAEPNHWDEGLALAGAFGSGERG